MATTTTTRSHSLTYPNELGTNWYNSFSSYAGQITAYMDNLNIIAITNIQDNSTSANILTFTHVASGTYCTVKNASAGSGAEITVTSSNSNEDLKITPKGSGVVILDGVSLPASDGTNTQILKTNGSGTLSWSDVLVSLDSSPELITNFEVGTYSIISSSSNNIPLTSVSDVVLKLGDAAGSKKVSIKDSSNTEVATIDSDGNATFVDTTVSVNANITTLNLSDNSLSANDLDVEALSEFSDISTSDKLIVYDTSATANKTCTVISLLTDYKAFAFVTFDPNGSVFVITGENVASITVSSSVFTLTFTTAMNTSTYTAIVNTGIGGDTAAKTAQLDTSTYSTTQFKYTAHVSGSLSPPRRQTIYVMENA